MSKNESDDFLFSGMDANDETLKVFDKQTTNNDGIYRPNLKDAKDKKMGYRATLRFLPNILENGKQGPSAIEKHIHYVDMKNETSVSGYYDCRKNTEPTCELCNEYWRLKNSKNAADNEKADLVKRTTKYYSYIMIIEDEQHPELVGKIMIYPYGYTIKEKINSERNGELTGEQCNIFHLTGGKDFRLIIKDKAGFQNYDASQFLTGDNGKGTPIKIYDEKSNKFKTAPVNESGIISDSKVQAKIRTVLKDDRTVNIDDHQPKEWDDQTASKVEKIIAILNGDEVYVANQKANSAKKDSTSNESTQHQNIETPSEDDFFSIDE